MERHTPHSPHFGDPTAHPYVALHKELSRERLAAIAKAVKAEREKQAAIALHFIDNGMVGAYACYCRKILKPGEK